MGNKKQEILQSAIEHYHAYGEFTYSDDWGVGQIDIDKILVMIEAGKKFDIEFTFAKIVTALDDETWELTTITASEDSLFVYPSTPGDMGEFWDKVDAITTENERRNEYGTI